MTVAVADQTAEDALIPLSALQHHLFCPRQCALIHVEGLWAEDAATAEGHILHERADSGQREKRPGVRIARSLAIRSMALGVAGRADVVEFHGRPPQPFPVEYKRGKPKSHREDMKKTTRADPQCRHNSRLSSLPGTARDNIKHVRSRSNVHQQHGCQEEKH